MSILLSWQNRVNSTTQRKIYLYCVEVYVKIVLRIQEQNGVPPCAIGVTQGKVGKHSTTQYR